MHSTKLALNTCPVLLRQFFTPYETDAKKILTATHLENWRTPPRHPRTTWMKTIQQDLKSKNLAVNEAINMPQKDPLWSG